jgi:hypothetical protein
MEAKLGSGKWEDMHNVTPYPCLSFMVEKEKKGKGAPGLYHMMELVVSPIDDGNGPENMRK